MTASNVFPEVAVRLITEKEYTVSQPIFCPKDAIKFIVENFCDLDKEVFFVVNLNVKNVPINLSVVSMGSLNTTIVHPREVYKSAILSNANAIILLHNHPSGSLQPSGDDIHVTANLCNSGKILDISVLDHIIFNPHKESISLRDDFPKMFYNSSKEIIHTEMEF